MTFKYNLLKDGPETVLTATLRGSTTSIHTREAGATDILCVLERYPELRDVLVKYLGVTPPKFACEKCGNDYAEGYCPHQKTGVALESPAQAWARGATLMRSMIQTHGKIPDDDPVWGIEIPEYRPPEKT